MDAFLDGDDKNAEDWLRTAREFPVLHSSAITGPKYVNLSWSDLCTRMDLSALIAAQLQPGEGEGSALVNGPRSRSRDFRSIQSRGAWGGKQAVSYLLHSAQESAVLLFLFLATEPTASSSLNLPMDKDIVVGLAQNGETLPVELLTKEAEEPFWKANGNDS